jgi:hypothetical protein
MRKPIKFKNAVNGEQWICEDAKQTKTIDGIVYITVRKPDSLRYVLMRRDSLMPIRDR